VHAPAAPSVTLRVSLDLQTGGCRSGSPGAVVRDTQVSREIARGGGGSRELGLSLPPLCTRACRSRPASAFVAKHSPGAHVGGALVCRQLDRAHRDVARLEAVVGPELDRFLVGRQHERRRRSRRMRRHCGPRPPLFSRRATPKCSLGEGGPARVGTAPQDVGLQGPEDSA